METRNRLRASRGEEGGVMVDRGQGTSQRTCMNDQWTWTTGGGVTVGVGAWAGWRRAKG